MTAVKELEPLMVTVRQAAAMTGCSEDFIRKEIRAGRLRADNKAQRKTLVLVSELRAWAEGRDT